MTAPTPDTLLKVEQVLELHLFTEEGSPLIDALQGIMRGLGHLDTVVVLFDTAAALAEAGGTSGKQFHETLAKVLAAREERGRGFSRPAGVRPS